MRPEISLRTFPDRAALDEALAERLARALVGPTSLATAAVMLSGGETPVRAYTLASARRLDAHPQLRILYSDERHVPADSPASNFGRTKPLLDALRLPDCRVLRVRTDLPVHAAADEYDGRLARLFADGYGIGLGLLGLGADGHTASLFSLADLDRAAARLAIDVRRPDGCDAVSVTPSCLARVAQPLFVVVGAEKRQAVASLLQGDPNLVAWRAVAGCAGIEVWLTADAYPVQERVQF